MRQRRHCKRFFDHKYIIKLFLLKTASLQFTIFACLFMKSAISVSYDLSLILCYLFRIFAGLCLLWPLFDLVLPFQDICWLLPALTSVWSCATYLGYLLASACSDLYFTLWCLFWYLSACSNLYLTLCCLFRIFAGLCLLWPLFGLVLPIQDIC
jgi:hypothetical protein